MLDELNTAIAQANAIAADLQSQFTQFKAAADSAIGPLWLVQVDKHLHGFPTEQAARDFLAASTGLDPVWFYTMDYIFHP